MSVYSRQRLFFREAYKTGIHGWPTAEPTEDVVDFIKAVVKENGSGKALDMGCGEGRHSIILAKCNFEVNAVDSEKLALEKARYFASKAGVINRIKFSVGNALKLRFPTNYFDLVLDCGCFHHIVKRDWGVYLVNMRRIIKPKAYYILTVFSIEFRHETETIQQAIQHRKRKWLIHRNHYDRFFTKADIQNVFKRHFDILQIRKQDDGQHHIFFNSLMRLR